MLPVPDTAAPPLRYVAAFNRLGLSRNAATFMHFMASEEARASQQQAGLEIDVILVALVPKTFVAMTPGRATVRPQQRG